MISSGADGSIANDIYIVEAFVGSRTSYDKMKVYLPMTAAQEFFSMHGKVHEYAVITFHSGMARELANNLSISIGKKEITVSSWQEVEKTFYNSMEADKKGNNITMGIVVFLICIGVLNTVLMSIMERTKEFGVMLAMGTDRLLVISMIVFEVVILGLSFCFAGFMFYIS